MTTPIKLYLPRIYLDTNILISAILESDDQWKSSHANDYQTKVDQIASSRQIFLKWEHRANQLRTSTFAVGEFVGRGSKQFDRSFKQMLEIVDREILNRCKLCETENLYYDKEMIPEKMRKEIRLIEIIGKAQVGGEFRYILFLNMAEGRMISGAGPEMMRVDLKDLVMQEIKSYKAPGFEIMLFQKASELANKYRLTLADAFHLFYAQGKVDYLITNDNEFLARWKENPMIEKETRIKAMSSMELLRLCKKRRYFN